jgi:hypothetical protein
MSNNVVARFAGDLRVAVALRLSVVSFVAGFLLDALLDPASEVARTARVDYGFSDLRSVRPHLLTGAMVVAPVWIVLRFLDRGKAR